MSFIGSLTILPCILFKYSSIGIRFEKLGLDWVCQLRNRIYKKMNGVFHCPTDVFSLLPRSLRCTIYYMIGWAKPCSRLGQIGADFDFKASFERYGLNLFEGFNSDRGMGEPHRGQKWNLRTRIAIISHNIWMPTPNFVQGIHLGHLSGRPYPILWNILIIELGP